MPEKILVMKKKKVPILQFLGLLGLTVFIIGSAGFLTETALAETEKDAPKMAACAECHEDVVIAFKGSRHSAVKADCTDCHGDGAKHIDEGGAAGTILTFKAAETPLQKIKQCLTCHKDSVAHYMSGPHAKASMDCTKCHSVHKKTQHKGGTKMCAGCHMDVVAEFQLNERHRLQEGILQCTSCHDPHGPAVRERLGGFKHESCLKCHTDKGGPFIYEHEASRIEGCSVCHEVHGSPNRHMLKHQNVVELCFSCHAAAPSWHQRFTTVDSNCVSCHSTIHGSNLDKIFLK